MDCPQKLIDALASLKHLEDNIPASYFAVKAAGTASAEQFGQERAKLARDLLQVIENVASGGKKPFRERVS